MTMRLFSVLLVAAVATAIVGCSDKKQQGRAKEGELHINEAVADSMKAGMKDLSIDADPSHSPEFPGGFDAMRAYIKSHVRMPQIARDSKKEGKVIVTAHVDDKGVITSCSVFSTDDDMFNDEALRVVRSMPRFTPAHKGGKAVAGDVKIAVMFRLK